MTRATLTILILLFTGCSPSPAPATPSPVAQATERLAPTPPAVDQNGQPVSFADLYKAGPVLVYFYPKADTPGCTAQACSLRDAYEQLTDKGVTVVGVSTDDQQAQKAFQDKYKLPFVLVSDPQKTVLQAFGVSATAGFANREAFLIKDGKIVWHDNSAATSKQAEEALAQMATWPSQGKP